MAGKSDIFLVLGGDVFVGRHVVERLKSRGDQVSVFDTTQRHVDVPFYSGDIRVEAEISDAIQKSGATCIIHTISPLSIRNQENPQIFHQVNVEGTKNVIEAAKRLGVRKLIYHSSSGVVFDGHDILNGDENLPYVKHPESPYTLSRILAEKAVLAANGKDELKTAVIRPAGSFGEGDQELIVGAYDAWKKGSTNVQLGDNKNLSDKTYVGNVALALVLAADKLDNDGVSGQAFFVGNNDPRPFWDFMRTIWDGFDDAFPNQARPKKKPFVIPRAAALLLAHLMGFFAWILRRDPPVLTPYTVTFATASFTFSSAKAKKLLGYEPEVSVDEGIKRTIKWWKDEIEAKAPH
ncbi:hypothetical protein K435DRAFT_729339 [Dendrothele bispora CBS 962.96]|uniref:3-beta hydroxysteroid dehydrogenase/isomerase domain-containing protein n=1 Tax=Dendrothele bispora (strain CBS 962.96) TaxID=1314807 RepID=A0A4V4HE03_DENBC|nr:hypothetical protein K435DRAFT_729339 [Dendrothele bispora CBS 962.96]